MQETNVYGMSRRAFLRNAAIVSVSSAIAGPLLAACQVSQPGTTEGPAVSASPAHVQYMWWASPQEYEDTIVMAEQFMEERPDIEVELIRQVGAYEEKLLTMYAANIAPDAFQLSSDSYKTYVDDELLLNLDPFFERDAEEIQFDDIFPWLVEGYRYNGALWGYPFGGNTQVIYYNVDMLRAKDLPDPNELAANDEWTWDAMVELAKELHETDDMGRVTTWGISALSYWQTYPLAAGGALFNEDVTVCLLDMPESIQGLGYLQDLAVTHQVMPTSAAELGEGGASGAFTSGRAGLYSHGAWQIPDMRQTIVDFEWNIAPEALGPGGTPQAFAPPGSICMAAKSSDDNFDPTWEWLKFYLSPENARESILRTGTVGGSKQSMYISVRFDSEVQAAIQASGIPAHILVNDEQSLYATMRPLLPAGAARFNDIVQAQFDQLFAGSIDPETAGNTIAAETNPLLEGTSA